jgi:hypothetical protein
MKIALSVALAAVLLIAAIFGYRFYENHKFLETARPYIKNSTLRLANGLRYETSESTGITYMELFRKLEEDVSETDRNILQIQTASTPTQEPLTSPLLSYLQSVQEVQRALVSKYRKQLDVKSALDRAEEAVVDLRSANEYTRDMYSKASNKAIQEAQRASSEHKEAVAALAASANRLKTSTIKLQSSFSSDVLIDTAVLDAVIKKNSVR